ncbi:MAG: RIP metalloprotease RseP, partial [Burkholderiales bacterium]
MAEIISFLIIVSVLVVLHEFGHYLFARLFKVKVITFSLGFGPKLLSFKGKHNEWRISSIPLGGYVRMLDEREQVVSANEIHLAFNRKKPYQKILIAAAGPLFNILFALLVYWGLSLSGMPQLKPVISSIDPERASISQLSITEGSVIHSINGIRVKSWNQADKVFASLVAKGEPLRLTLEKNNKVTTFSLGLTTVRQHYAGQLSLEELGLYPVKYLPIVAYIEPGSPAATAGLKINDQIVAVNGTKVANWFQVMSFMQNSPNQPLAITLIRDNQQLQLKITPESVENDGQLIGKVGIMPTLDHNLLNQNSFIQHYNAIDAFTYAVTATYTVIMLNVTNIYNLVKGNTSLKSVGGPITIAKVGSSALTNGFKSFLGFLALISLGLAIMNLLPIPVLDGGHI